MTVRITGYHSHLYFDENTIERADALAQQAAQRFDLERGRIHRQCVGPHPRWSCQLGYRPELLAEILPWLALNRAGLTVFSHPETGDELKDHTDYAIWMGEILPLNLDALET